MKNLFIAILAVCSLAACQKNQILNLNKAQILFYNPFVNNQVRATDNTYSGVAELTKFNVYGTVTGTAGTVNIFNGVEVNGTVGAAEWSYDEQYNQYWIPGASYAFAAVVDGTVPSENVNNMPLTLKPIADATMNFKDLLYDEETVNGEDVTKEYNTPVNFTFEHLLSKAHFTVTSNAMGRYYHSVTGIKVQNITDGTYTISSGAWSGNLVANDEAKTDWVSFGDITEVNAESKVSDDTNAPAGKTCATQMLLVPTTRDFLVTFTVELFKDTTKLGTETKTITVPNDLVKGNAYNFTIECTVGNPIKFTVTNDPTWSEPTEDVTIQ